MMAQDKRLGTGPADLKRYLQPLLQERDDLVLIGRLLLIRPVRHLLRGAMFERTSDKYSFRLRWYVQPLCDPYGGLGYGDYFDTNACPVWQPHFEPLLMDTLAEDVFSRVGPMTTLGDFVDAIALDKRGLAFHLARGRALVLGGDREGTKDYIRELRRKGAASGYFADCARELEALLARDIDDVCAEFHAREAETVKEMKLEKIWEPSPFAAELPNAERARSDEPRFSATPWIDRPSWLLQKTPDRPGEVCFAKATIYRDNRRVLLVPLSSDEAENRHRHGEPYVLAARSQDGLLNLIWRDGLDHHDPDGGVGFPGVSVEIYGRDCRVRADTSFLWLPEGSVALFTFTVFDQRSGDQMWHCFADVHKRHASVWDRRGASGGRVCRALSDADVGLLTFAMPPFGQFDNLVMRIRTWLRSTEFGEIT
jgi:hypothetical protein